MPEPTHEERAGARVYKETAARKTDRQQYREEAVRNAGDTADAIDNTYTEVQAGLGIVRPTGQHTGQPRGDYATQERPAAGSPDPFVGLAAGVAVIAEAARVARARAARRRRRDGNH